MSPAAKNAWPISWPVPAKGGSRVCKVVSRTDNEVRDIAAETTARRIHDSWLSSAYQGYNPHFRAWAKERGIGLVRQELGSEAQQDFMREVTRAMRGDANVTPQAKAAGDVLAENYRKALMDAKRAGIPGFEDVNPNTKYVPRLINERKLMEVYRKVGLPGIQKIIRSDSEWDQLVNTLKTNHAGDTKIKEYLSRLNEVKDLVLGRSIVNESGTVRRTAQVVRKLNFARTMGQAGMASLKGARSPSLISTLRRSISPPR